MFVEQGLKKVDVAQLPYSLEGFIAWLETQDPQKHYDWELPQSCAAGQFRRAVERCDQLLHEAFASVDEYHNVTLGYIPGSWDVSYERDLVPLHTFGQCLERAKVALAARK